MADVIEVDGEYDVPKSNKRVQRYSVNDDVYSKVDKAENRDHNRQDALFNHLGAFRI